MIVITLNANSGYDIAALNAKEFLIYKIDYYAHRPRNIYIYIYIYDILMAKTPGFSFQFF